MFVILSSSPKLSENPPDVGSGHLSFASSAVSVIWKLLSSWLPASCQLQSVCVSSDSALCDHAAHSTYGALHNQVTRSKELGAGMKIIRYEIQVMGPTGKFHGSWTAVHYYIVAMSLLHSTWFTCGICLNETTRLIFFCFVLFMPKWKHFLTKTISLDKEHI